MDEKHPEWGYDPESPFGFAVMSRADWRKVFAERPGQLFDEYNREAPDPVAWLDGLKAPEVEQIALENASRGPYARTLADREHRDLEGFRFGAYEFS